MANNVTATQIGAQPQVLNSVNTVQDIMTKFDLKEVAIKVNGQARDASYQLEDYDFVSFGEKVKGGFIYRATV